MNSTDIKADSIVVPNVGDYVGRYVGRYVGIFKTKKKKKI